MGRKKRNEHRFVRPGGWGGPLLRCLGPGGPGGLRVQHGDYHQRRRGRGHRCAQSSRALGPACVWGGRVAHVAGRRGWPPPYPHPTTWGVEPSPIANGGALGPGGSVWGRGGLLLAARRAVGWARPRGAGSARREGCAERGRSSPGKEGRGTLVEGALWGGAWGPCRSRRGAPGGSSSRPRTTRGKESTGSKARARSRAGGGAPGRRLHSPGPRPRRQRAARWRARRAGGVVAAPRGGVLRAGRDVAAPAGSGASGRVRRGGAGRARAAAAAARTGLLLLPHSSSRRRPDGHRSRHLCSVRAARPFPACRRR